MEQQITPLKIMIVDDEELSRQFVLTCIDWKKYHCDVIFTAVSGMEALTYLEDEQEIPDIIFSDIKMPYMNGLELSELILNQYPGIKIVILTAYKDFEYAQKSVHIGISSFLLKPLSPTILIETITNLRIQIEKERMQWHELNHLKTVLQDNYAYLREQFILGFMESLDSKTADSNQLSYYYKKGIPNYCQVTILENHSTSAVFTEEEQLLNDMKILEYLNTHLGITDGLDVISDHKHHIILISYSPEIKLEKVCTQIQYSIQHLSGLQISFGIGKAYPQIYSLSLSYREAMESLKLCHYDTEQTISVYENDFTVSNDTCVFTPVISEDVKFAIKAGLVDEVNQAIMELYKNEDGEYISIDQARVLSVTLFSIAITLTNEIGLSLSNLLEKNSFLAFPMFHQSSTQSLMMETKNCVEALTKEIALFRSNKRNNSLWEIIGFIQKEYTNPDMSLNMVAEYFHMNDSYLSRIFKKELGFSFSKYVNRLRMNYAIELLTTTEMKVYQIAEAVGIPDAYYFSNCFKKHTGKSVRDYKKDYSS